MLAKAVGEGRVALDDDVRKYLEGSFPNLEFQGHPIRLWQLLNHTSGLPRDLTEDDTMAAIYTAENFLKDLHKTTLERVPGVKFSYSNIAAQLLGLVLERVYGKPYQVLIEGKITRPLGMSDTKVALTPRELAAMPHAERAGSPFIPVSSNRLPAAGSLKSSTEDMLKYIAWNLSEADPAVKLSHQKIGSTDWGSKYFYVGLNWQIVVGKDQRIIFQDGYLPGFHSMCAFCPERHLGIVVLSTEKVNPEFSKLSPLMDQILKRIDPEIMDTP